MNEFLSSIEASTGLPAGLIGKGATTLALLILALLLRAIILRIIWKRTDNAKVRFIARKTASYTMTIVVAIVLFSIWLEGLSGLPTYLGLLSAGLAIALKDPLANFVGWLIILATKPFTVGDRIQIGTHVGDLIDIRVFRVVLLEVGNWVSADQGTGRILYVPNSKIFLETVANYNIGFPYIWNELPVLVTFESDWRAAKAILKQTVTDIAGTTSADAERSMKEASKTFLLTYRELGPAVFTSVRDSGVLLTIRYLCDPRKRRSTEEAMWERILDAFGAVPSIELAYPTQRFYDRPTEIGLPAGEPESKNDDSSTQ